VPNLITKFFNETPKQIIVLHAIEKKRKAIEKKYASI
jgi:hypothetical protein